MNQKKNNPGWVFSGIFVIIIGVIIFAQLTIGSIITGIIFVGMGVLILKTKRQEEDVKVNEKVFDDFPQLNGLE